MRDLSIRFPVTCPLCGDDSLDCRRFQEIVDALFRFKPFALFAPCHGAHWTASAMELEQIRDYVGAALLGVRGTGASAPQTAKASPAPHAHHAAPLSHHLGAHR
jgi:hypothetical protein